MSEVVSMELTGLPVMLGDTLLELPQPVTVRCETEIRHVYERVLLSGEVEMSPAPIFSFVTARTCRVFAGGRLVATAGDCEPIRDEDGETVAVRFAENQTVMH